MQARTRTIWLVRLAMAASLLAPIVLFAFAAWNSLRTTEALTDERLARTLDVENEEAQRTFQLVGVALNGVKDLIAGMSADDIRRDEPRLHALLKKLDAQVPLIQSIWIFDKDGTALVSSWDAVPSDLEQRRSRFLSRPSPRRCRHLLRPDLQFAFRRPALFLGEPAAGS